MTPTPFNVGAFVLGALDSLRALVHHADLLAAYADGTMAEQGEDREAYLSHFVFGEELQRYYAANRNSVAYFNGSCWCRWLVLDIDRADHEFYFAFPAGRLNDLTQALQMILRANDQLEQHHRGRLQTATGCN